MFIVESGHRDNGQAVVANLLAIRATKRYSRDRENSLNDAR